MRETLQSLFSLVENGVLTNNYIALYLFYKLREGTPTSQKIISKSIQISIQAVNVYNAVLERMKLICIDRPGRGKSNIPYPLYPIKKEIAQSILSDDDLLSDITRLKDMKFSKYSPGRYSYRDINNINNKKGVTGVENSVESIDELKIVADALPEEFRNFSVTPSYIAKLRKLAASVDLKQYSKWFVKKKLGVTVHGFNLSIFTYSGIVAEYKVIQKRIEKSRKYKKTTSIGKSKFKGGAARLNNLLRGDLN